MRRRDKKVVEILASIATSERVSAALSRYAERGEAIERLLDEISANRARLVADLRRQLLPREDSTRAA